MREPPLKSAPDGPYRFDRFVLDPQDRRLTLDGRTVELTGRYLDALILMVREQGRLVTKTRFMDEVWRGVPVTDEALTQCVRSLRRALGDDAASPRFIETEPRHGYRFIAPVAVVGEGHRLVAPSPSVRLDATSPGVVEPALAGAVGGGCAGALGGLVYGALGVVDPLAPGLGAASAVLVVVSAAVLLGLVAGAGVGLGVSLATRSGRGAAWRIVGGAIGGLAVGSIVKLIGLDAFALVVGTSPGDITGGAEGAVLGAATGLGAWLAARPRANRQGRRAVAVAALAGAAAGLAIALTGGQLLGGSLAELAERMPGSRLSLDGVGGLFGEAGFGPVTRVVATGIEGMLFAAGVVAALVLAARRRAPDGGRATSGPAA